jgi:hypothetical protein
MQKYVNEVFVSINNCPAGDGLVFAEEASACTARRCLVKGPKRGTRAHAAVEVTQ